MTNADGTNAKHPDCLHGIRVEVNPTLWGYVIKSERVEQRRNGASQIARKAAGVLLAAMAFGIWAGHAGAGEPGVVVVKMGASGLFGLLGAILLRPPRHLVRREMRMDTRRGVLAVGRRTASGRFGLDAQHAFGDIDAVLLQTGADDATAPRLMLKLRETKHARFVAEGPMTALKPLADRLARDLGAPMAGFDPVAQATGHHDDALVLGPRLEVGAAA